MESVAVIKVAVGVKRAELVWLHHDYDLSEHLEPVFKVRQKLLTSLQLVSMTVKKNITSYTEEVIKAMMLAVVSDENIRREVLST